MNHFSGTTEELYADLREIFTSFGTAITLTYIIDTQTMNVEIGIDRDNTPSVLWALLTTRIINFISAGVGVSYIDHSVFFGYDLNTINERGWDIGRWKPLE
jgi:hypothetical protein